MEEIYVIKLRGLPQPGTPSSSSNSTETRDLLYDAILGLGVMHLVLGSVALLLGILELIVDYETVTTGAGIWCGFVFLVTGVLDILASRNRFKNSKTRLRAAFWMSIFSTVMATIYLVLTCLGVSYLHWYRPLPNHMARVGGNAIVTAFVVLVVASLSTLVTARALWPYMWLSLKCLDRNGPSTKVIVSADVFGGCGSPDMKEQAGLSALRQLSPNCVISFKQSDVADEKREAARRVEEYVRGCDWISQPSAISESLDSYSDVSGSFSEDDNGVDYVSSENWRNETVESDKTPAPTLDIIPYYNNDYSVSGC